MRSSNRLLLLLICAAAPALIGVTPAAQAQPRDATRQAKQLFKQGLTLYRLSEFKAALGRFEAALKLETRASVVFNIAQCHRQLGDAKKAVFYYKLYLSQWSRQNPDRPSPYESEVNKQIAALEARILREAKGTLKIVSAPPGAEVSLDGRARPGRTPLVLRDLEAGEHGLELRKDDLRYQGRVEVVGGTQTEVQVALARVFGALEVTSTPAGAAIRLDGEVVGKTPRKLTSLPLGQHTLELRRAGHVPSRRLVMIDGPELQRVAVSLGRLAALKVASTPPGATVVLDGKAVGQAPVRLELEPGKHTVSLRAPGRQEVVREIEASAGATLTLAETLALDAAVQEQVETRRSKRIWAWTSLSVGIAGVLTGLSLVAMGYSKDDNAARDYADQTVQSAIDAAYDERLAGRRIITGGIVAGSVGLAAVVFSIVQFVTAPAPPEEGLRLGLGLGGGGATLRLGGVY